MSKERVKEFYAAVSEDEGLRRELEAALEGCRGMEPGAAVEKAVLPVAASAGFEFSAEDVAELGKELAEGGEASDADLAAVSGGSSSRSFAYLPTIEIDESGFPVLKDTEDVDVDERIALIQSRLGLSPRDR